MLQHILCQQIASKGSVIRQNRPKIGNSRLNGQSNFSSMHVRYGFGVGAKPRPTSRKLDSDEFHRGRSIEDNKVPSTCRVRAPGRTDIVQFDRVRELFARPKCRFVRDVWQCELAIQVGAKSGY